MLITENSLDEWVRRNSEDAKGVIVELLSRLSAASCPKPRERRFPLGDSIGQHGPDGVLDVLIGFEPFIPDGYSYWEIGTGLDAGAKATADYSSLTSSVPASVRSTATFVFVTPLSGRRDWEHTWKPEQQAPWLSARRNNKEWKDVRIIDGTKLVDWLRHLPSVELWLASKISSIPPGQIETPMQRWDVLTSIAQPLHLAPELFLAKRADAVVKLREVFDGTTNQLRFATRHPEQVVDFVAAYLASLDEADRAEPVGRCLVVSSPEAWNAICDNPDIQNHILVADSKLDLGGDLGTRLIQKARKSGHAVIFAGPQGGPQDPLTIPLVSPQMHQMQEALKKTGYTEERSRSLVYKSGGNLSSLLRLIQNLPIPPDWALQHDAGDLAIAALLGAWTDESKADQSAVAELFGSTYADYISSMRKIAVGTAPPLVQHNGEWRFVPRFEGWYSLGQHIYDEHLERLKGVVVSVLTEVDPQFQLPTDERFGARVHGKVLAHSRQLRVGLAQTLAMLGSHGKALTSCSLDRAEAVARSAVRQILDQADWMRWASLNDVLPLLAEAAPEEFLSAVEKGLQSEARPFDEIFAQEGDVVFGGNYHTGLLWGLETLAWEPDYLGRAAACLAELATRDPGGQHGNRPSSSLREIFLPWFPQTCAPVSKRATAVKMLLANFPEIGWNLLLSLMPDEHGWSSGSRRPEWRTTISEDRHEGVSAQEYWDQISAYADLAVEVAKSDVARLAALLDHMDHLRGPAHEQLLEYLESDALLAVSANDGLLVWTKLTDMVSKHRRFPDAQWAMPKDHVDRLAAIATRLQPKQPHYLHQRLFSENDARLFEEDGDYMQQMQELDQRRQEAIAEVAEAGGVESVLDFARAVQSPWRAGIAFGIVAGADVDTKLLPSLLESETKALATFAGGFVRGRFHARGWEWVDSLSAGKWSPTEIGKLLSFLPFARGTWNRARTLLRDDQSTYWATTPVNPYEADSGLEDAIESLIAHGRPLQAIDCLHKIQLDGKALRPDQAIRALLEALRYQERQNTMDVYEATEIIKAIQKDPSTDSDGLFSVEWAYLAVLDGDNGAYPTVLWGRMADDPKFFCEIIRLLLPSKKEDRREDVTEAQRKIATNAYRLLSGWKRPPGLKDDGSFDGDAMNKWLEAVREECAESGHLDIAMQMFGHVLNYVPADPNGLWLHTAAADVLNSSQAEHIRISFESEMFNSRGMHWVDPTGKPEKELAAKYREQAEALEAAGYVRLAATLRNLAHSYDQEAARNIARESAAE